MSALWCFVVGLEATACLSGSELFGGVVPGCLAGIDRHRGKKEQRRQEQQDSATERRPIRATFWGEKKSNVLDAADGGGHGIYISAGMTRRGRGSSRGGCAKRRRARCLFGVPPFPEAAAACLRLKSFDRGAG